MQEPKRAEQVFQQNRHSTSDNAHLPAITNMLWKLFQGKIEANLGNKKCLEQGLVIN